MNDAASAAGKFTIVIGTLAEEHPTEIKVVVGTTVALTSLKVATLVGGYAFMFLKGGLLSVVGLFYRMVVATTLAGTGIIAAAAGAGSAGLTITAIARGFAISARQLMWSHENRPRITISTAWPPGGHYAESLWYCQDNGRK